MTNVGSYDDMDKNVWLYFLNKRKDEYPYAFIHQNRLFGVGLDFITNKETPWYEILDLIEYICRYYKIHKVQNIANNFHTSMKFLNLEFSRHNFAYRLIDGRIAEITSENEIKSIEEATNITTSNVKIHLQEALEKLSPTKTDYRNSIKESISAVECLCRDITGENTLDKALKKLENKGINFNSQMKKGLENLYYYTNDGNTGIRHALMDDKNAPTADEAIFMLVSCSAFVNYLMKKKK